jgi:hypothetical protein
MRSAPPPTVVTKEILFRCVCFEHALQCHGCSRFRALTFGFYVASI